MGFKQLALKLGRMASKNSPTILTYISVGGLVVTTFMAIEATPKALSLIDDEVYLRYTDSGHKTYAEYLHTEAYDIHTRIKTLKKREIIKITWKCYIPTGLMLLLTGGCIIGANSIHLKRNAALAGIFSLTEATLKEYQAKVVETLGETKAQKIQDDIYKDRLAKDPVRDKEIIITGKGDTLCYETISGRYFKNDIENIRKIQNDLNRDMLTEMFISLNDVYYALGLSPTKIGDELGWDVNNGLIEFNFSSQLADNGIPCLVLDYGEEPRYNFRDY
jgi:hypothetical protein